MINLCELKLLIEIERTQIKRNLNTDHLGYGFIEPTSEIEAESMKVNNLNIYNIFEHFPSKCYFCMEFIHLLL